MAGPRVRKAQPRIVEGGPFAVAMVDILLMLEEVIAINDEMLADVIKSGRCPIANFEAAARTNEANSQPQSSQGQINPFQSWKRAWDSVQS